MRAFAFPLRRALEWRRTMLDLEESKLRQIAARSEELELAAVRLGMVKERAEQSVCHAQAVEAHDLWALSVYRRHLMVELDSLGRRRRECEQELTLQQEKVLEAQGQCRLLEKLEDRRRAEWGKEAARELENLAAESYLATWNRKKL